MHRLEKMKYPLVKEIPYQNSLKIFSYFSQQNAAVFLDSAQLMEHCGHYSFIAIDPFCILLSKNGEMSLDDKNFFADPFQVLSEQLAQYTLDTHPELPSFQGGAAGFFSYDLCHHLEKLPRAKMDDMQFPDMALGFYDLVLAFDELKKQAWIFSSGYPEQEKNSRELRAKKRLAWLLNCLAQVSELPLLSKITDTSVVNANFYKEKYHHAVRNVIDYILAGDIFQANISQRFKSHLPSNITPFDLYRYLRNINPAPFSAYLNFSDTIIASASPERFLKLNKHLVETRPIKGTRQRGKTQSDDEKIAKELLHSEKDRAENVMIVDLLRNDLSRVCENHSVQVPQLCGLESYATVHHLVSVVKGTLRKNLNAVDLLRAAFPGGSVTGAPKIRAMEIIAEIEPTQRGPYCGSVGYIGFNGDMDTSITIRTYAIKNNMVTFQAGGAVTADSDPAAEYDETLVKASALHRALNHDFVN